MADQYAEARARVRLGIAEAKASTDPLASLRELERKAMASWGPMVATLMDGLERVNSMRGGVGMDREPTEADALEFPNWTVAEIRNAIAEVQS